MICRKELRNLLVIFDIIGDQINIGSMCRTMPSVKRRDFMDIKGHDVRGIYGLTLNN